MQIVTAITDVLLYTTVNFRHIALAFKVLNFMDNRHVTTLGHINN